MTRYAQELSSALTQICGESRTITVENPRHPHVRSGGAAGRLLQRVDSAWWRYVTYPRLLRHRHAAVFHLLDHSDAHLVRSLDPARTVVTCHDLIPLLAADGVIPMHVPATVLSTYRWRIAHLRRARAVIAVSHATKAAIERYTSVRPDRIIVVPQGVSSTFRPDAAAGRSIRAWAGVPEASPLVLQVASAGRYKNTNTLLQAFARLRSRLGKELTLVRIGVPLYADEAALAVRLGIVSHVRHVGAVDDATLAAWYNAADVLVFPSWWEGFGWPPLEAMACGTPVIASNIPAVAEVVADAGMLLPADDPSAMANAVEMVLSDVTRRDSMRRRGLERAAQFTWARAAAATLAVYDSVLQ